MSDFVIREATSEDFGAMSAVQRRAVDVTLREHYDGGAIDEWLACINVEKFRRVATSGEVSLIAVKDGEVVERGNHEELLAKRGIYREIFDLQLRPQEEVLLDATIAGDDGGNS